MGELTRRWVQAEAVEARSQRASPGVDEDHVYVGGLGEDVYALSRETGGVAWTATRDGALSDSSPTVADGRVYVGSGGGSIHAFDAADGTEHWRHATDSAIGSTPVVGAGTVFAGRDDGGVVALAATDGTPRWRTDLEAPIYATPAYGPDEDCVYVATKTGSLHALDADSGSERWTRSFGTDVGAAAPVVADGRVYFAANELMALRTDSGQSTLATDFFGASAGAAPVVDDERVYVAGANGNVHGLAREGPLIRTEPAWTFESRETFVADPVRVGDALVVASLEGTLFVLRAATGEELDREELPAETRSPPTADRGELYLGSRSGSVFAYALSGEP